MNDLPEFEEESDGLMPGKSDPIPPSQDVVQAEILGSFFDALIQEIEEEEAAEREENSDDEET